MFFSATRNHVVDLQRYMRRMIDATTPDRNVPLDETRSDSRYNRAIPTLLCPWEDGNPVVPQSVVAITKNIADRGISAILNRRFTAPKLVVGFCTAEATNGEPWFLLGEARHEDAIGGSFWLLGIELTEFMNEEWRAELAPLLPAARQLLPPCREQS
jgi:hypothetical protein